MNILNEECYSQKKYMRIPTDFAKQLYYYVQWAGRFSCKKDFKVERGGMQSILLMYTISGSGKLIYNGNVQTVSSGTLTLIDCMNYHMYHTISEPWTFEFLHFYGGMAKKYADYINELYESPSFSVSGDISRRIHELIEYTRKNSSEEIVSDFIYRLLIALISEHSSKKDGFDCAAVERFLSENYMKELNVEEIALLFGYSRCFFSTRFKEVSGKTPYAYLMHIRLLAAKEMLRSTSYSIMQISEKCGFNSVSSFIRAFGNAEKITPFAYRKRIISTDK